MSPTAKEFDPASAFAPAQHVPAPIIAPSRFGLGVYDAIGKVAKAMAAEGIAKTHKNTQGGVYMFRGIDDVMNTLAPVLAEHGLVILPKMISRVVTERATNSGGTLFCVVVEAAFNFVAVEDGSSHTVVMYGEAFDSGDKATNKAMSAAYKYACFQAFCIPVAGTPDADEQTHDVAPPPTALAAALAAPAGFDDWLSDLTAAADTGTAAMAAVFSGSGPHDDITKAYRAYLGEARKDALKARALAVDAAAGVA